MSVSQTINGWLRKVPSWPLYFVLLVPGVVYFFWAVTNQLGVDPLARLEHQLGEWALQLLIATLLVSPIRKLSGVSLIKYRRALGLMAFFYVCAHLLTWLVLDKQFFWNEILADLVKRPYIIVGMIAFVALIPLALTSNNWSIRRLGPKKWGDLHKLGYLATACGAIHYLLLVKAWPPEPVIYAGIVAILLAWRINWARIWTKSPTR